MQQLLFVWIGEILPEYAKLSLDLASRTSKMDVVLICNRSIVLENINVKKVNIEDFYVPPKEIKQYENNYSPEFRNGFWFKTLERFFIISQYSDKYNQTSFFHAELDNLVFDLTNIANILDSYGTGMFIPSIVNSDNKSIRSAASLIYVNSQEAIFEFCKHAIDLAKNTADDMAILQYFANSTKYGYILPAEDLIEESNTKNEIFKKLGIFDEAIFGQYFLGIDPRNARLFLYNRDETVLSNTDFSLKNVQIYIDIENASCHVINSKSEKIIINNLHLHSKAFEQIINHKRLRYIQNRFNNHKRTIIYYNLLNCLKSITLHYPKVFLKKIIFWEYWRHYIKG